METKSNGIWRAGVLGFALAAGAAVAGSAPARAPEKEEVSMPEKIVKTDAEWRAQLTPEQYRVTRQQGTERACSGAFWDNHEAGTYSCVCCGAKLFSSEHKFESGTGWPSYFRPLSQESLILREDRSLGMVRTEVLCARCDAHLGHVF